jgi:hypothetical protein
MRLKRGFSGRAKLRSGDAWSGEFEEWSSPPRLFWEGSEGRAGV